ncbi:carbamoyl-phosphate synthase L chain, ATP binding domain protein [Bordetella holmesii 70147]|nr:carbamoyl-phosphate synthase L chain, ATP binding domain protein [Bordetella holmesii 70147]
MGAKVSFVTPSAGVVDKRRLPPGGPVGGAERRLDIHVLGQEDGHVETGRAWERSVWRDQRVLIAECPAPRLSARMEATLRDVASCIAVDRGWLGLGTAVFALDDQSGQFRLIEATLQGRRGKAALMEPMAAHALEVGIGACAASGRPGPACWCGAARAARRCAAPIRPSAICPAWPCRNAPFCSTASPLLPSARA